MPFPDPDPESDYRRYLETRFSSIEQAVDIRFEGQKEAVAAALTAAKEATAQALTAAKEAVIKAELAVEKRLEGMNEFRGTLSDQANTFMPRVEAENRIGALADKLTELSSRMDRNEGRGSGMSTSWIVVMNVVALAGGLIAIFFALSK